MHSSHSPADFYVRAKLVAAGRSALRTYVLPPPRDDCGRRPSPLPGSSGRVNKTHNCFPHAPPPPSKTLKTGWALGAHNLQGETSHHPTGRRRVANPARHVFWEGRGPGEPEPKQWMIVRPKRTPLAEPAGTRSFSSPSPICSADSLLYGSDHNEGAADRPMEVLDRSEKQRKRSGLTTDASKRSDICLRDQGRRWKNKNIEVRYMSTRSGSAKETRGNRGTS